MKAAIIDSFGNAEVIRVKEVPNPKISQNEVLIRVKAAGLNPIDWKSRAGKGVLEANHLPYIPGWDVAGVIVEVGSPVGDFKVGDAVFGMLNFPKLAGTHAEYVAANPDHLAIKPSNLSFIEAAATPLAALTAWQGLLMANLQPKQQILIHAAAGGVGHLAVQLAKLKKAYVIGTASEKNRDFLRTLGLDQWIDYHKSKFDELLSQLDVVFDGVGGEVMRRSLSVIKPHGHLITLLGHRFPEIIAEAKSRKIIPVSVIVKPSGKDMAQLAQLIFDNQLKITIDSVFSLNEVVKAYRYLEQGHRRGKVVLNISQ